MDPQRPLCVPCLLRHLQRSGGDSRLEWTPEEAARLGAGASPPRQDSASRCPPCERAAAEAYWAAQFTRAREAALTAWQGADPASGADQRWRAAWLAVAEALELGSPEPPLPPSAGPPATFADLCAAALAAALALHRQAWIQAQARAVLRGPR